MKLHTQIMNDGNYKLTWRERECSLSVNMNFLMR